MEIKLWTSEGFGISFNDKGAAVDLKSK